MENRKYTGYTDANLQKIYVGDRMRAPKKSCGCVWVMCTVKYNEEWQRHGLFSDDGEWISGMGIVGGLFIENEEKQSTKTYRVYDWVGGEISLNKLGYKKGQEIKSDELIYFVDLAEKNGYNIMIVGNTEKPYIMIDTKNFKQR